MSARRGRIKAVRTEDDTEELRSCCSDDQVPYVALDHDDQQPVAASSSDMHRQNIARTVCTAVGNFTGRPSSSADMGGSFLRVDAANYERP